MTPRAPRIWVLLGERRGDNNQLLGLAETVGVPFETRSITYGWWWWVMLNLFPTRPFLLTGRARSNLTAPWPDLVIGIGRRSVAVARWIKDQSGGRTKIVRLGNPRADNRLFDLVITTPQYPVPRNGNVLALPFAISRNSKPPKTTADEAQWLASLPRPHLLVCLGGPTRYWKLVEAEVSRAAQAIFRKAGQSGGTVIVATSQRTPASIVRAIEESAPGCHVVADGGRVRFPVLLADADEHYVTADSVSMISETLLTGRPVGLIPVELDAEGKRSLGVRQSRSKRDIRRFWSELDAKGLRGTVEMPVSGTIADPVEAAAAAVKRLLGESAQ